MDVKSRRSSFSSLDESRVILNIRAQLRPFNALDIIIYIVLMWQIIDCIKTLIRVTSSASMYGSSSNAFEFALSAIITQFRPKCLMTNNYGCNVISEFIFLSRDPSIV